MFGHGLVSPLYGVKLVLFLCDIKFYNTIPYYLNYFFSILQTVRSSLDLQTIKLSSGTYTYTYLHNYNHLEKLRIVMVVKQMLQRTQQHYRTQHSLQHMRLQNLQTGFILIFLQLINFAQY